MKKLAASLFAIALISVDLSYAVSPALALGGCGPNRHRLGGRCVWGGQNEAWCLRHTGHRAVRMPNGNLRCFR